MIDIRRLDFDDLSILEQLIEGKTISEIAGELNVSQPAISQRLRKIEDVFSFKLLYTEGRRVKLTSQGTELGQKAISVLSLMREKTEKSVRNTVLNIGTRPEVGMSWLGPALFALRAVHPEICFHVHIASGHENLQRLGTGGLDAILTSAPLTVRDFRSIELLEEEYVFIASTTLKPTIKTPLDLRNHVLIEYDRSFPFQNYIPPSIRADMQFRDVWFLGSTVLMTNAILEGHGVGVVPLYLVREALKLKKVKRLPFIKDLGSDNFRFILKAEQFIEDRIQLLAKEMLKIGLR